jgi:hypothetical protein
MNRPLTAELRAPKPRPLPVAELILGKPVEEAAQLLPRLFNLCRVAQGTAARAAFGLPPEPGWQDALRMEILRAHVAKLCVKWPELLSRPAVALPRDWPDGTPAARRALFGPAARLPETADALDPFFRQETGVAPVLGAIADLFPAGTACRDVLPHADPDTLFRSTALENSVAARRADHPVLEHVAATQGRGPLWSAMAVAYDVEALLDWDQPRLWQDHGCAAITAARGIYGITARVADGRVAAFSRVTPTDHLLAEDGALDQSLAGLPADRAGALAPLVVSILDPCHPVSVEAVARRERTDA